MTYSSQDIAIAFNQQNDKKSWNARTSAKPGNGHDMVHFNSSRGLVSISYNTMNGLFSVKFNKFTASWGDYVTAIARSMYVILNTLKSAGLPFDAPATIDGMEILVTKGSDDTYVRWPGPPNNPVMPELRTMIDPYDNADWSVKGADAGFEPVLTSLENVVHDDPGNPDEI